mmetsp:Transcript_62170/g.98147  ORF Transcript_62170/g.98147 Transcript_62170/m.98147 type:complete len:222 (-) Transcript_62170:62-727(-)
MAVEEETGIPLKSSYPEGVSVPQLYAGITSIMGGIGFGIGYAVYRFGATAKYDAKIDILAKQDLGWVYLGFAATKFTHLAINTNLGMRRKEARINVPDQQVYKVHLGTQAKSMKLELGYVLMEQDGVLGAFNRAQRALQLYLENLPHFLASFFVAGYVFPFPTFVTGMCIACSRTAGAIGYTTDPNGRMAGGMFSSLMTTVLEGFIVLAGAKAVLRTTELL